MKQAAFASSIVQGGELGWAVVMLPLPAIREWMIRYFVEEAPQVEIVDSSITMHIVPRSALTEADQQQSVGIRARIRLLSEQFLKVSDCNVGKSLQVILCDAGKGPVR